MLKIGKHITYRGAVLKAARLELGWNRRQAVDEYRRQYPDEYISDGALCSIEHESIDSVGVDRILSLCKLFKVDHHKVIKVL